MKLILLLCAAACLSLTEGRMCHGGFMRDADTGNCTICPRGTYSEEIDATSCTSCPDGLTTEYAGTYNASDCFDASCSPGQGYNAWYWGCAPCERGRYSPDGQTIGCLQCPEGYTTEGTGAESLDDCLVCWRGWERQGEEYVPCPVGSYRSLLLDTCQPCEHGSTSTEPGSSSCVCLPGFHRANWYDFHCSPQ